MPDSSIHPLDLGWAAGFLEGEGHFRAWRSPRAAIADPERRYVYMQAQATQKDREPLERLQAILGGKVYGPYANNRGATYHLWTVTGSAAVDVVALVEPHLSTRRREQIAKARLTVAETADRHRRHPLPRGRRKETE